MHIKSSPQRQPSIKTFSLNKSSSAAANVIYGQPKYSNYDDSLENFKKDFATLDKQLREKHQAKKNQSLERRKLENLEREIITKQNQESKRLKMIERQKMSQQLYNKGELKTTLANGIPINPMNSQYLDTKKAQLFAEKEHEKDLNRAVRAHYLHTLGNSGYNIITGSHSIQVQRYVPNNQKPKFQQKLTKLYSQRKINLCNV